MANPPKTPKWLVVGQHNNHFHLWKEVYKDIAHQLNELQQVEARVSNMECHMGSLSLQMEGVEVQVAKQEVVGNRLSRLVLWSVGGILHLMAKVDFLQHLVSTFISFGEETMRALGRKMGQMSKRVWTRVSPFRLSLPRVLALFPAQLPPHHHPLLGTLV